MKDATDLQGSKGFVRATSSLSALGPTITLKGSHADGPNGVH